LVEYSALPTHTECPMALEYITRRRNTIMRRDHQGQPTCDTTQELCRVCFDFPSRLWCTVSMYCASAVSEWSWHEETNPVVGKCSVRTVYKKRKYRRQRTSACVGFERQRPLLHYPSEGIVGVNSTTLLARKSLQGT
jgi:hypothetical protein